MTQLVHRVLVTGSREFKDRFLIYDALDIFIQNGERITLIHGGARGADTLAADWAKLNSDLVTEEAHPLTNDDWRRLGNGAGPWRNGIMVRSGADVTCAFLSRRSANSGTRNCMKQARLAGIPIEEHWDS